MSKGIVVSVATKAADKPAVRSLVGGVVVASAGAGLFAVRLADVVAGVLVGFGAVLIVGGVVCWRSSRMSVLVVDGGARVVRGSQSVFLCAPIREEFGRGVKYGDMGATFRGANGQSVYVSSVSCADCYRLLSSLARRDARETSDASPRGPRLRP